MNPSQSDPGVPATEHAAALSLSRVVTRRSVLKAGAAMAASAVFSPSAFAQKAPIKLGVVLPFSGVYTKLGEEAYRGIGLYLDSVNNAAGGRAIQILREDEEASADAALRKVTKLIRQDNIDLLTGINLTPSAYAIRDLVDASKLPWVCAVAGGNLLTRARKSPYIFRTSFTMWQEHAPLGKWTARTLGKRAMIVSADAAFGKEASAAFKGSYEANGGKIVEEIYTPFPSQDFSPYMARIAAAKPDVVFSFLAGADATIFLRQFTQFGLNRTVKLAVSGEMLDEVVLESLGDAVIGSYSSLPWAYDLPNAENQKFIAAYRAKYKGMPNVYAERGYVAARAIVEALKRTKGSPDAEGYIKAMRQVSFLAPRGLIAFDPATQQVVQNVYVRQVARTPAGLINKVVLDLGRIRDAETG